MTPYSATSDDLKRCGIDPDKFISWRQHAKAAALDNDFNVLVPLYVRAQEKHSHEFEFGENPVQDMITLGATREAAARAAHISLEWYGHRTPISWAEMLMKELVWGME